MGSDTTPQRITQSYARARRTTVLRFYYTQSSNISLYNKTKSLFIRYIIPITMVTSQCNFFFKNENNKKKKKKNDERRTEKTQLHRIYIHIYMEKAKFFFASDIRYWNG